MHSKALTYEPSFFWLCELRRDLRHESVRPIYYRLQRQILANVQLRWFSCCVIKYLSEEVFVVLNLKLK